MPELEFGIHFSCQSPDGKWRSLYTKTIEQAKLAEQIGYTSLFVAEHHFLDDGWIPTPEVLLGGIAGVTSNMKIGSDIIILPLHSPVSIAERAAVLDLLSGGKFNLGVGIGWRNEEFDAFGVDKSERVPRIVEGIELIRRLHTEDDVTYTGDVYSVGNLTVTPKPVQQPVPIWYGGQSKRAIARAARIADAWIMSPIETRPELRKKVEFYESELNSHYRSLGDVHKPLRREAYIAEDDETAWEEVGDSLLYEYAEIYGDYDDIGHSFQVDDREDAIDRLRDHAKGRFIIGSPETAIEEIERYNDEVGFNELLLRMHFPGMDPDLASKSMRLFANEVIPRFN